YFEVAHIHVDDRYTGTVRMYHDRHPRREKLRGRLPTAEIKESQGRLRSFPPYSREIHTALFDHAPICQYARVAAAAARAFPRIANEAPFPVRVLKRAADVRLQFPE